MESLVFISYSHTDTEIVQKLHQDLVDAGIAVWVDHEGLRVGAPVWEEAIREAIRESRAVILVASPESRQSRYVRGELSIAEMYQRPVFPIWVGGDVWEDCVPMHLIGAQYADARNNRYADAFANLLRSLKGVATSEHPVVRLTPHRLNFAPRNPYKGLRAFASRDKQDFFGRQALIDTLIADVKTKTRGSKERFIGIVGSSGSGKSSVVMAGLLPRLQEGALPNSDDWYYLSPVLPGSHPLESLAIVLADEMGVSIATVLEDLQDNARGLHLLAKRITKQPDVMMVLVVDQLEELFTQTVDPVERDQFIDLLVTAATESDGAVLAVVTLRADFYDRPMNYEGLGRLLEQHSRSILPMTLADLRDVIEKPASLPDVQLVFEDGLVGDLLFDVRGQAGALPLLQFALDQLVENRRGNLLPYSAYKAFGGVKGALANHADEVYNQLPSVEHQEMTKVMFLRMIEPGETEQDTTRRRVPAADLTVSNSEQTKILDELIHLFTSQRLLTTNKIGNIATIEVSHEALIREWGLLANWVRTAREDIRLQRTINYDSHEWVRRGNRPDDLYRGAKLAEALEWAERNMVSVTEHAFIHASILAHETYMVERVNNVVSAEEATRKKLARDLHDGPAQNMSTIAMSLNNIRRFLEKDPPFVAKELEKMQELARQTNADVRHMLFLLRPLILETNGLGAALRVLGEKIHHIYGFKVHVEADLEAEEALIDRLQGTAFYIIEAAANNAGKHAQPTNLWIRLQKRDGYVIAEVQDDGVGFDAEFILSTSKQRGSFGIVNIHERAELIDAQVQITSVIGQGATIRVMIPV